MKNEVLSATVESQNAQLLKLQDASMQLKAENEELQKKIVSQEGMIAHYAERVTSLQNSLQAPMEGMQGETIAKIKKVAESVSWRSQ